MVDLVAIHRAAVRARRLDERLTALARAGRIGAHPDARGFEPALAAAVLALAPEDAIYPGLREHAVALVRGLAIDAYVAHAFGTTGDLAHGHAVPAMICSRALRIGAASGLVSNHLTHAVGHAWAAKMKADGTVTLALFGEAAANAGEFHTAVNFAGTTKAPVIFLCRTDRVAGPGVPSPLEAVADKAIAYGVESTTCSADDPASVHAAVTEARARALQGRGPTLVEANRHETDPLARLRDALLASGALSEADDFALGRETSAEIEAAVRAASSAAPAPREAIFRDVFAVPGAILEAEERALLRGPASPVDARRENES